MKAENDVSGAREREREIERCPRSVIKKETIKKQRYSTIPYSSKNLNIGTNN